MKHLIDRDAVVAEIERLVNNQDYALDYEAALEDVRNFLDTLEVKEVDIDKEIGKFFGDDDWKASALEEEQRDMIKFAKHFFELGMRTANPTTVEDRGMAKEIIINLKRVENDYHIDLTKQMEWLRNIAKKGE